MLTLCFRTKKSVFQWRSDQLIALILSYKIDICFDVLVHLVKGALEIDGIVWIFANVLIILLLRVLLSMDGPL